MINKKGNFAFIDSQNLNLGIQKMGWKLDWRKFRKFLKDKYGVTKAYMFIGYMQENEALYEQMHDLGYLIVLKPTVEPHSEDIAETANDALKPKKMEADKKSVKGNTDADMVLYVMKEIPNYNQAVIVSGDGDFFGLIEHLIQEKKLKNLMTPNWQYSTLLKDFDEYIVRLDLKRRELAYKDFKKTKKSLN